MSNGHLNTSLLDSVYMVKITDTTNKISIHRFNDSQGGVIWETHILLYVC